MPLFWLPLFGLLLLAVELLVSLGVVPYVEDEPFDGVLATAPDEPCCALESVDVPFFAVAEFVAVEVPAVLPLTPAVEDVPSIEPDCGVPLGLSFDDVRVLLLP